MNNFLTIFLDKIVLNNDTIVMLEKWNYYKQSMESSPDDIKYKAGKNARKDLRTANACKYYLDRDCELVEGVWGRDCATSRNSTMTKSNILTYKGYIGEITFDRDAKIFYGETLFRAICLALVPGRTPVCRTCRPISQSKSQRLGRRASG